MHANIVARQRETTISIRLVGIFTWTLKKIVKRIDFKLGLLFILLRARDLEPVYRSFDFDKNDLACSQSSYDLNMLRSLFDVKVSRRIFVFLLQINANICILLFFYSGILVDFHVIRPKV